MANDSLNINKWGKQNVTVPGSMALDLNWAGGLRSSGMAAEVTQGDKKTILDRNADTVTDQMLQGNDVVTVPVSFADLEAEYNFINTEGTHTVPLNNRSEMGNFENSDTTVASPKPAAGSARVAYLQSELVDILEQGYNQNQDTAVITSTSAGDHHPNNFTVDLGANFSRTSRITWAEIQDSIDQKIIPNELYEDADGEYELTTYNLTIFMASESALIGTRLSEWSTGIKSVDDIKRVGAVIIAQTSGTDQFYIESLEFKTGAGKTTPISPFEFVIKSPYEADFVDHLFKAGQFLKVQNSLDFPLHLLIEWRGRNTKTSLEKKFNASRCYPFRMNTIGLTMDESGGTYTCMATRTSEMTFGQDRLLLKEDITIAEATVGEAFKAVLARLQAIQVKGQDNVLVPDIWEIEMPSAWAAWELKTDKQAKNSNISQELFSDLDTSVDNVNDPDITSNLTNARSDGEGTKTSSINLAKLAKKRTFSFGVGTSVVDIIQSIINQAVEMQKLVTGLDDPQAPDAQQRLTLPDSSDIERYYMSVDADVAYLAYDKNTRQYACKRIYVITKRFDPQLSINEENTKQDESTGRKRLYKLLQTGVLVKAYPYYYSGLNTEIKSLDYTLDNHYIVSHGLYSSLGGSSQRTTGINADKVVSKGAAGNALYNDMRDQYENAVGFIEGKIDELDATLASQTGFLTAGSTQNKAALEGKLRATAAQKTVYEDQVKLLEQHNDITAAQLEAIAKGELRINTESIATTDSDKVILSTGTHYFTDERPRFDNQIAYVGDLQTKTSKGVMYHVPFTSTNVSTNRTGTVDDTDRGENILAATLNQGRDGDMINISLEIRGDPYWIPETFHLMNKHSITPNRYLTHIIILASQGNDHNAAGVLQVNDRNGINSVYFVIRLTNRFAGGEFTQTLELGRDNSIDLNTIIRNPDKWNAFVEHTVLTGGDGSDGSGWE
jgi:hypothetical protein